MRWARARAMNWAFLRNLERSPAASHGVRWKLRRGCGHAKLAVVLLAPGRVCSIGSSRRRCLPGPARRCGCCRGWYVLQKVRCVAFWGTFAMVTAGVGHVRVPCRSACIHPGSGDQGQARADGRPFTSENASVGLWHARAQPAQSQSGMMHRAPWNPCPEAKAELDPDRMPVTRLC